MSPTDPPLHSTDISISPRNIWLYGRPLPNSLPGHRAMRLPERVCSGTQQTRRIVYRTLEVHSATLPPYRLERHLTQLLASA